MKKGLFLFVLLLFSFSSFAQSINGISIQFNYENVSLENFIRDVETKHQISFSFGNIDLNQKINLPYYFPIDTTNISTDRRSLFDTLVRGIKQGRIKEAYSDSFFTSKITQDEIESRLVNVREENGYTDTYRISTQDVEGYMIKGMWYFDKRQGELKYRLLALAPMGKDVQSLGVENIEDENLYELFWIFFPAAREVLHETKVFNPKNASQPISYDHLLNARRFSGVIVREENVYGNRAIEEYVRGNSLFQLLEADKIKENIRNREMDMWNY